MKEKSSAILISNDKELHQEVNNRLLAVADITDRTDDISLGYTMIKDKKPDLVFFDMTGPWQDFVNLAQRVKKIQPATQLFFINNRKDPDLILQGFRMGITDFLLYPFNGTDVEDSVKKALDKSMTTSGAEIFTIFSLKGGIGVTTTALNLADQIHDLTGDRVLLLDLNLFMGDVCTYLDKAISYSTYDLIRDMERMDKNLLFSSLFCHKNGFYILSAPEEISDSDSISQEHIINMLFLLKQHFDYIIIDCSHDFSGRTLEVCTLSDKILVLAQQNIPTAKSVQKVIDFFDDLDFEKDKVKVIINKYLKDSDIEDTNLEEIFQQKIFFKIRSNESILAMAANKGLTLGEAAGKGSRINKEIRKLAGQLTGIKAPQARGWKRLFQGKFAK